MNNSDLDNILKVKNEIEFLLVDIEQKENVLTEQFKLNALNLVTFKTYLEDLIEEYHNVCKKIYK